VSYIVDFKDVSTIGLESSQYPDALAGLRANEARYFKNKFDHDYRVEPANKRPEVLAWVNDVLAEKEIKIKTRPLEVSVFELENIFWVYVFYENGLSINVKYHLQDPKDRAVGFKLCDEMEIPDELKDRFKFASMKSKLAGTIRRGSYFVIKNTTLSHKFKTT